jgi:hypothetical protein
MALTANIATIAKVYVSVECPARSDASAHESATSTVPAKKAPTAQ